MSLAKRVFKAIFNKTDEEEEPLKTGMTSAMSVSEYKINTTITRDILTELLNATNKYDAVDIVVDKTPFGAMALNVYSSLTNPDGEYIFEDPETGERLKEPELLFKEFQKKRFINSDAGLDAVFDVLVRSNYTRGDMAFEIIVDGSGTSIIDVKVIDPKTFEQFKWNSSESRWEIYQKRSDNKSVDLYQGNFYRFPYQQNIENPYGKLPFESSIVAISNYYQHNLDGGMVLNRVGYPRFLTKIDSEAVLAMAKPDEKNTHEKRNELLMAAYDQVESGLRNMQRDSDVITFKENDVTILGGVQGAGIDLRSWYEMDAVEICNAFGLPKIYLNLEKAGSYALGSAEQQVLIDRVDNSRDYVVKAKEIIANTWCRVNGISAVCRFDAKPIEWEKLEEKWRAFSEKAKYYRRMVEYGWISNDTATNIMTGEQTAVDQEVFDLYEFLQYQKESEVAVEETN